MMESEFQNELAKVLHGHKPPDHNVNHQITYDKWHCIVEQIKALLDPLARERFLDICKWGNMGR